MVWTSSAGFLGKVSAIKHEKYKLMDIEIKHSVFKNTILTIASPFN